METFETIFYICYTLCVYAWDGRLAQTLENKGVIERKKHIVRHS